ncbi:GNAT family N-acetyltransferase [Rhizobium halophytocola]|uniref:Ribosomal protein S18 acetylase RimI-like enzyme n=1 Tax=Rhizobium halophytocola TaxID=735519 RepID=A0ABS4E297_9HYPH|nr:GNAT family N-acetyltransferase [Rhizobium halophytocola]MBP1852071.1 ribosomal protein S18 acetylase RimI-like enzyme [Rhizobium halophytocola]
MTTGIQDIPTSNLPLVRRLEAVGFRAWPSSSVQYDGSWQLRLNGGYPSKRLNCLVPLDPSDHGALDVRFEKAERKFASYGRSLILRETPLTPPALVDLVRDRGWSRFDSTVVMTTDLQAGELPDTMDHLPSHDVGRFVDAVLALDGEDVSVKPGLAEVISAIQPPTGLFVIESPEAGPIATTLCVQDNDLAGILTVAVASAARRQHRATEIVSAALRWARVRGARTAWLAVGADNHAARALYAKFGFAEVYRYHYWRAETVDG